MYYKKITPNDANDNFKCYYCGENASCFDHTPPISLIESYIATKQKAEFLRVPSCIECNAILKNYDSSTLSIRMEELKRRLERKYSKVLKMGTKWTEKEIIELQQEQDNSLNRSILDMYRIYLITIERLNFEGFGFHV